MAIDALEPLTVSSKVVWVVRREINTPVRVTSNLMSCSTGDCILQELSFIEGGWPRATMNDKPFLATFPYEADPWPDMPEKPGPVSIWQIGIWILLVVLILIFLWSWLFYYLGRRSAFREQAIQV